MGGEQLAGEVFLNPASRFRSAPQGPDEFINEDDPFFAVALAGGDIVLVARARVESMSADRDLLAEEGELPVLPQPVRVAITTASGAVVHGTIAIDAPPSHARLLDFLNTNHERFLRVADAGRVILVNRQAIGHVHEQS